MNHVMPALDLVKCVAEMVDACNIIFTPLYSYPTWIISSHECSYSWIQCNHPHLFFCRSLVLSLHFEWHRDAKIEFTKVLSYKAAVILELGWERLCSFHLTEKCKLTLGSAPVLIMYHY